MLTIKLVSVPATSDTMSALESTPVVAVIGDSVDRLAPQPRQYSQMLR